MLNLNRKMENTSIKSLFGGKLRDLFAPTKPVDVVVPSSSIVNPENRRQGETYEQWGRRICGKVEGSLMALRPYLQKVYNHIYNEQANNIELQEQARANTQADIERKNNELINLDKEITDCQNSISEKTKKIEDLKAEQTEIKSRKATVNKEQKMKLTIGMIILLPLTVYLFLFYSSTFYSAFFRDPQSMTTVMNSMFDSNALVHAWQVGWAELGFVLCAPIIFLGLGFSLHFFSKQQGSGKYMKITAVLFVTLMFDCILAYKIGEQLHTFGIIIGQYPIGEEYSIGMAFKDINSWAVIFCGFIVYIIWGIVFNLIMDAYNNLDLNKTKLEKIESDIADFEKQIETDRSNIKSIRQREVGLRDEVARLMAKLGHETYIDYSSIRTEMNNFFAGWITTMQHLNIVQTDQDEATNICNEEIFQLTKQK